MKFLVGAVAAAAVLVGVAASQPAEARCFWNGFAWECWHHPRHFGWGHDRAWDRWGWDHHPWDWDRPHWRSHWGWERF